MLKFWLVCGGLFGFLAVAFGAFGTHGLAKRIPAERLEAFESAVRYQMYHALALLFIGILEHVLPGIRLDIVGWAFVVGTLLFCGSVYMYALTEMKWLDGVAPVGGIVLLIGWGWLVYQFLQWLPQ